PSCPTTGPSRSSPHTLSLHDALPISATQVPPHPDGVSRHAAGIISKVTHKRRPGTMVKRLARLGRCLGGPTEAREPLDHRPRTPDRKSTRLNSSHEWTSYAVFCQKTK